MSEQQDQWRMTLPKGQFFENIQGDDALSQPPASVTPVVVPVVEESSVPATDESLSTAPAESEGSAADEPVVAPPAAPEIVPPADTQ